MSANNEAPNMQFKKKYLHKSYTNIYYGYNICKPQVHNIQVLTSANAIWFYLSGKVMLA